MIPTPTLLFLFEQFDEVDAGGFGLGPSCPFHGRQLAVDHRVDGPRRGFQFYLKPDLNLRDVERLEAHFDGVTGQMRRSLVETVMQQEGGIPAHHTIQAMEEETAQIGGGRELADLLDIALPTRERGASERAMFGAMINAFDPDPQAIV